MSAVEPVLPAVVLPLAQAVQSAGPVAVLNVSTGHLVAVLASDPVYPAGAGGAVTLEVQYFAVYPSIFGQLPRVLGYEA